MSETPAEAFAVLHAIAQQGFTDALEICCLIQIMERQNQGHVVTNLTDRGAGSIGIVIRNGLITRLTLLVARCYAPIHRGKGDRHIRRAFDEVLKDAGVRARIEKQGTMVDLLDAETMWAALYHDPQREQIKHFRDKSTAHLAQPDPNVSRPSYAAFFDFARRTARLMERLAHASGGTRERLNEHFNDFAVAAEIFWAPRDQPSKSGHNS
jgi:hypothetical protein